MNNPAQIMERLAAIEADLADRQNEFARAAGKRARLVREVELAEAVAYQRAKLEGAGPTDAKQFARATVGDSQDYKDLTAAEAAYEAGKAAVNVLSTRATINQTLIRTLREAA